MGFLSENKIKFLDREAETRRIHRFMASPNPGLLGVHGPGGIGKTVLIWRTADECHRLGIPHAHIDLADFPFTDSVDAMKEIAGQLDSRQAFASFWELLSGYHSRFQNRFLSLQAHKTLPPANLFQSRNQVMEAFLQGLRQLASDQPVVLLFDNLDAIPKRQGRDMLEKELFSGASQVPTIKMVIASRGQVQWHNAFLEQIYTVLHLVPFDDDYAKDLTRAVLPDLLERDGFVRALKVSGGHPYSVIRLAKTAADNFDLTEELLYQRLLEELWANVIVRFMLKGVNASLQKLLSQVAIVRFFDLSGLKYFSRQSDLCLDAAPVQLIEVMDLLNREVSAVRFNETTKGYQLQPPIRPVSLEMHRLSKALDALNGLALRFYQGWLEHLPPGFDEWRRGVIEVTYHQGVIGRQPDQAKVFLARSLAQLGAQKNLEAAIKLRNELGQDRELPAGLWQDVFAYFEARELGTAAA